VPRKLSLYIAFYKTMGRTVIKAMLQTGVPQ